MSDIKCDHKWRNAGMWDGKTPDGQRTGGQMYKCDLCGDKASSKQEIADKGGTLTTGTGVMGKPLGDK